MRAQLQRQRRRIVLYQGPGAQPMGAARRAALTEALLDAGHPVTSRVGVGSLAPADDSPTLVLGSFDAPPSFAEAVMHIDPGDRPVADVVAEVDAALEASGDHRATDWKPWFPVIDYSRCTNCMQCLTFCLFDVYGVDDEKVIQVQHNDNCKTDCPACSRVCPEAAIMFPKYSKSPINGAPVRPEDVQQEAMKVDISALLGGDIYATLRDRQQTARKRFSTERDESKALLERKRCLAKLKRDLDIPDEVLMTLPSAGDIEERARRAKAKAERRAQRSQSVRDRMAKPATPEEWDL